MFSMGCHYASGRPMAGVAGQSFVQHSSSEASHRPWELALTYHELRATVQQDNIADCEHKLGTQGIMDVITTGTTMFCVQTEGVFHPENCPSYSCQIQ